MSLPSPAWVLAKFLDKRSDWPQWANHIEASEWVNASDYKGRTFATLWIIGEIEGRKFKDGNATWRVSVTHSDGDPDDGDIWDIKAESAMLAARDLLRTQVADPTNAIFTEFAHKIVPDPGRNDVLVVKLGPDASKNVSHIADLLHRRYAGTAIIFCREGDDLGLADEETMRRFGWVRER